jgi:hypothetical protein
LHVLVHPCGLILAAILTPGNWADQTMVFVENDTGRRLGGHEGEVNQLSSSVGEQLFAIVQHEQLVRPFPYTVFYEYTDEVVTVYGVFHTAQDPDK